ncbi:CRE-SRB-6 protein [Caenorhabditis remanei]|uniref:CRE-SRB-6 protein n=1 Tax=Caenorhabditis remanei TaxID=31234 RepID=E3NHR3_CAERE|nr:CRE-SRB-6 protein [Caenorhabditis remanei]
MLYFAEILLSVFNNVVVFSHHVITPIYAENNCDLLVDTLKNKVFQNIGVFGVSCPMLTILGITFERLLALIFAHCYERVRLCIGLIIGIIAVVCDMVLVWFFFRYETFEQPSISYFMVPDSSGYRMNILCWWLLAANAVNLVFNYILVKVNVALKKKWRSSLSTRFQMEENIITTKFSTFISFVHVFFFSLYLIFTLGIRLFGSNFLTTPADFVAVRGVYITIPTYNLVIGVASCIYLRRLKGEKSAKVHAEVTFKYAGYEAAQIHEEAMLSIWRTHSSKKSIF